MLSGVWSVRGITCHIRVARIDIKIDSEYFLVSFHCALHLDVAVELSYTPLLQMPKMSPAPQPRVAVPSKNFL